MRNLQISHKSDILRRLITIIVVILNSGFALTVGRETEMIFVNVCYVLIDAWIHGRKIRILKDIGIWVMVVAFMALTFIAHLDFESIFEYARIIIIMFSAYYIVSVFSFDELVNGFCKCMRLVAVVSCLFYLAYCLFPSFPFPTASNAVGVEYYTCLIGNINVSAAAKGMIRNSGLFWEGGMYAALITLWMICEIEYMKRRKHFGRILAIALIALLTTNSTSGYLYIVMLLFLLLAHNSTGKRTVAQSLLLMGGFGIAIFAVSQYEALISVLVRYNRNVFEKLLTRNASFTDRFYGPVADLWTSLTNPLGVGLLNLQSHVSKMAQDLFGVRLTTRTSTLTYFFAAFGPVCGIFVNWQWWRVFRKTIDSKLETLLVSVTFLILATSTPLQYTFVFWIIVFLGNMRKCKGTVRHNEDMRSKDEPVSIGC